MPREFVSDRSRSAVRVGSRRTSELAARAKKRGVDVLHLSGAPIVFLPQHVTDAAASAAKEAVGHTPSRGIPELRQAVSEKLKRENRIEADPETEVLVTNGGNHALYIAMTYALNPGDEVVVPSPCYFFDGFITLVGGVPVYAAMREDEGFALRADILEEKITSRTKVIILNTPVNPTGHVGTMDELEAIGRLAVKHDLLIVSDESYEKMAYDGRKHISIASIPGLADRTITIHSFTKAYGMPSWRLGYTCAPAHVTDQLVKILEWTVLCCGYVGQKAALAALTGPQGWTDEIGRSYQKRRDIVYASLSKIAGVSLVKPQGGPFVFPNISRLGLGSESFARLALDEYGIPADPGHFLQSDSHIRIPFGAEPATLQELGSRLGSLTEKLMQKNAVKTTASQGR